MHICICVYVCVYVYIYIYIYIYHICYYTHVRHSVGEELGDKGFRSLLREVWEVS